MSKKRNQKYLKKHRLEMTTFFEESQESQFFRRMSMPDYPPVTKRLVPAFKKHNIEFVPKSVKLLNLC